MDENLFPASGVAVASAQVAFSILHPHRMGVHCQHRQNGKPMDIRFTCTRCGQHIVTDEADAGFTVTCPTCNESLLVPKAITPTPDTTSLIPPVPSTTVDRPVSLPQLKTWLLPSEPTSNSKPYPSRITACLRMMLLMLIAWSFCRSFMVSTVNWSYFLIVLFLVLTNAFLSTFCTLPAVYTADGIQIGTRTRLRISCWGVMRECLLLLAVFTLPIIGVAIMAISQGTATSTMASEHGPGLSRGPLIILPGMIGFFVLGALGPVYWLLAPIRMHARFLRRYYTGIRNRISNPLVREDFEEARQTTQCPWLSKITAYTRESLSSFNFVFVVAGGFLGFALLPFALSEYYRTSEIKRTGVAIEAKVTSSKVILSKDADNQRLQVKYSFTVGRGTYSRSDSTGRKNLWSPEIQKPSSGELETVKVRYSPQNPWINKLESEGWKGSVEPLGVIGFFLAISFVGILCKSPKGYTG